MSPIPLIAMASGMSLTSDLQEIATQVAGNGRPNCTSQAADGSSGPCLPRFEVIPGTRINAWQTGIRIAFSQAATIRVTRDEFALLAGHEIAHYYLEHKGRTNRVNELAADRFGAQLACQAGFNPAAGASLFRHLHVGTTHPRRDERQNAVLSVPCSRVE